jgi:hypothetical protein
MYPDRNSTGLHCVTLEHFAKPKMAANNSLLPHLGFHIHWDNEFGVYTHDCRVKESINSIILFLYNGFYFQIAIYVYSVLYIPLAPDINKQCLTET